MREAIERALGEAAAAAAALASDDEAVSAIEAAARRIADVFTAGGRLWACGNGGSLCDAMHLAEELSGRFRQDRRPLPAAAISDPGHLTCTANDFGYEAVFARFVEAHGAPGDVLVAISTSGGSPNVLAAARRARAQGVHVVALTGRPDSPLGALADVEIRVPASRWADRVQELHIEVVHVLVEMVERQLFPGAYAGSDADAGRVGARGAAVRAASSATAATISSGGTSRRQA